MEPTQLNDDTIVAVSTAAGVGGIAVIRLSGPNAISIVDSAWKGKRLVECASHTAHLGDINGIDGETIDQVIATIFKAPNSFTGEDVIEISCHGSTWIQREIVNEMIRRGARPAEPGEFTRRAFLNGKLDLAQAEGVADLIAASSRAAHHLAIKQANGHFSAHLNNLREQLIEFASLLELELDFSEEEVEFADRERLRRLSDQIIEVIGSLAASYASGKAYKEGIPVVIAGEPNAGKSSLLNQLLDDDKAIVSEIPGTTRDIIEDTREINGILFRFIDTAGLRETKDEVERMGIDRAEKRIENASIILWMIDSTKDVEAQLNMINEKASHLPSSTYQIILLNKTDLLSADTLNFINPLTTVTNRKLKESNISANIGKTGSEIEENKISVKTGNGIEDINISTNTDRDIENINITADTGGNIEGINLSADAGNGIEIIKISAKTGNGIDELKTLMCEHIRNTADPDSDIIVTNGRHYALLLKGLEAMKRSRAALDANLSADFIAQDVREALHHLGAVTGTITTPDLLASIFTRFCIGK